MIDGISSRFGSSCNLATRGHADPTVDATTGLPLLTPFGADVVDMRAWAHADQWIGAGTVRVRGDVRHVVLVAERATPDVAGLLTDATWVERVVAVTGWVGEAHAVDWAAVEARLGIRLPGDYKQLAEIFGYGASTDPAMKNKIEDSVAAIDAYRGYLQAGNDDVTVVRKGATVELQVKLVSRKLTEVQDRAYVKNAVRELDPVLTQLRGAGVATGKDQITLSRLTETLTLDAGTGRIQAHRLTFGFLIPYNGGNITYRQNVGEENRGVFKGSIGLPAGLG